MPPSPTWVMWGHQGCGPTLHGSPHITGFNLAGSGHDAALAAVAHLGHVRHHGGLEHARQDVRELRVGVQLLQRGQEGRPRRQRQLGQARVAAQVQDLRGLRLRFRTCASARPLSARPARPHCLTRGPAARRLEGRAQTAPQDERQALPAGWAAAGR